MMSLKKGSLSVLVLSVLVTALLCPVPASFAAKARPYLWTNHMSRADIVDGKAVYDAAEFLRLILEIDEDNLTATEAYMNARGTLTISGGGVHVLEWRQ